MSDALFDILPAELVCLVLDYLLPHQLTGFALSCRRSLEATDDHLRDRVSSLKGANRGVTLRWASRFRNLPPVQQSAIETTVGVLPLLDVFALDKEKVRLYLSVASAYGRKHDGQYMAALSCIKRAEQAALKTGLDLDLSALRQQCWRAQLDFGIMRVNMFAAQGFSESTLSWIEKANTAAIMAGRPLPDFSGVLQECWEKEFDTATLQAEHFARQGADVLTSRSIEEATEAGLRAGRALPDFSVLMRECWEKKLDITMKDAEICAQQGHEVPLLYNIKKAEEAADKAGCRRPDWSEVMQQLAQNKRVFIAGRAFHSGI